MLWRAEQLEELVKRLMPVCLPWQLRQLVVRAQEVTLGLISDQSAASCPLCGEPSRRVQSHYNRTLLRSAWGSLRLHLRWFFCQHLACSCKIFTEPLPGLAEPPPDALHDSVTRCWLWDGRWGDKL